MAAGNDSCPPNCAQPWKAPVPMVERALGNVGATSRMQPEKAWLPMVATDDPRAIDARRMHPWNAESEMAGVLFPTETWYSLSQFMNAPAGMAAGDSPVLRKRMLSQSLKASVPTEWSVAGKDRYAPMLVQPWKA